jgi:hypothetical protein
LLGTLHAGAVNSFRHRLEIVVDFGVPKTQHQPTFGFEEARPSFTLFAMKLKRQ